MTIDENWAKKDLSDIFDEFRENNWKDKLRGAALIGRIDAYSDLGILTSDEAERLIEKVMKICDLTVDDWDKIMFYGG